MSGLQQDTKLVCELIAYAGSTAAEVAKGAKLDPGTLQKAAKGKATNRLSQRTLDKLREAYPRFPGWTASLAEQRQTFNHQFPAQPSSGDSLEIPMLELAYGMGGSILDNADGEVAIERFPTAFVRMFTRAPADQLAFASGIGDSMAPTIGDRDLLLIDRSIEAIRMNDQIWALVTGGIGMVKRVRVEAGDIWLLSDNETVPNYRVAEDELNIVGRVVAITRRL